MPPKVWEGDKHCLAFLINLNTNNYLFIKTNSKLRSPPWKKTSDGTKRPFINPFVKEETTNKALIYLF